MDRKTWLSWLKLCLGVALVGWLIESGRLDINSFASILTVENAWLLASIFAMQIVSFSVICARWMVLTSAQGIPVSFASCLRTGYQGLSLSLLVPGSLGFDGIRILHISKHHKNHKTAGIASVVMDRILGLVGLLILAITACWLGSSNLTPLLLMSCVLLLPVVTCIYFICVNAPRLNHPWISKYSFIKNSFQAFHIYNYHKLAMVSSVFLSIIGHLIHCASWLIAIKIVGVNTEIINVVAITSVVTIVRTIPITPMGLGVTDTAAESLYQLIDISEGAEIQMLIRLVTIVVLLLMALSFYKKHGDYKPTIEVR